MIFTPSTIRVTYHLPLPDMEWEENGTSYRVVNCYVPYTDTIRVESLWVRLCWWLRGRR